MTQFRDVADHKNSLTALTILVLFNEGMLNVKTVIEDKDPLFSTYIQQLFRTYIQQLFRNHLTLY